MAFPRVGIVAFALVYARKARVAFNEIEPVAGALGLHEASRTPSTRRRRCKTGICRKLSSTFAIFRKRGWAIVASEFIQVLVQTKLAERHLERRDRLARLCLGPTRRVGSPLFRRGSGRAKDPTRLLQSSPC